MGGYELVDGRPDSGSLETFRILPPRGRARLLAPASGNELIGSYSTFANGRGFRGAAITSGLWAAVRLGQSDRVLDRRVSLVAHDGVEGSPLRELLESVLHTPDFSIAIRLTSGRPNAKLVVAAISPEGEPFCFAKLAGGPHVAELVRHESRTLADLAAIEHSMVIPEVLFAGDWQGVETLITTALPMRRLPRSAVTAHRASDDLCRLSGMQAAELAASGYWDRMKGRLATLQSSDGPEVGLIESSIEFVEDRWGASEFEFGRGHGDWSRANLGLAGKQLVAIDWERSQADVPRNLDLAHFALIDDGRSAGSRLLDVTLLERHTAELLALAGRSSDRAQALTALAVLEMVVRFAEAVSAGLEANDAKFGPLLRALTLRPVDSVPPSQG